MDVFFECEKKKEKQEQEEEEEDEKQFSTCDVKKNKTKFN
jgi:hypothetical protein